MARTGQPREHLLFIHPLGHDMNWDRIEGNWKQIKAEQIEGIIREYLAIAYYWWKGYV